MMESKQRSSQQQRRRQEESFSFRSTDMVHAASSVSKAQRSTSTISEDSPGLIEQDSDVENVAVTSTGPKIKLSGVDRDDSKGYISSEDESYGEKRQPRKSIELSAKLSEEFKFGRLGLSDKEALLKKTRRSFQADGSEAVNGKSNNPSGTARSLSPGNALWANDNRFHDDLYFTEDKNSSNLSTKSKSDNRVNRK